IIVAGDFGQLPPAGRGSAPLYTPVFAQKIKEGKVSMRVTNAAQKIAFGKAIWHQFTEVILLTENMRQAGMSEEDHLFRKSLVNLRFGLCDEQDLALFRTRVSTRIGNGPRITDDMFQSVAIITSLNAHRDQINLMGASRFAADYGRDIISFYSVDRLGKTRDVALVAATGRNAAKVLDPVRTHNVPQRQLQDALWSLPPCESNHHAGVLQLCWGMPVMLKNNEATELCATNGAEGYVVGWDASPHPDRPEHLCLNTVFVQLANPPKTYTIATLPPGVVPITATHKSVECALVSGTKLVVNRRQPQVLLNFAMTDYCSQGRTRPINPVDIHNCRSQQAVYTCLSRSSSLRGTLILQPFSEKHLTCGLSGQLRRELRELEILSYIGLLRHEERLDTRVQGATRYELINSF
ncbi:hypothetical protein PUNSTDRAFT_39092, partial [Punctularia strigosozonata HHB-11173 SS5]|uniref:uncharacterized protein n=1 Tax=Punctularia strigosozonata (strain HHB-11173) TaxID=741275 RepID=UPI0004417988